MAGERASAAKRRMESWVGPRAQIDGREVDYFCGTSYFGLHAHPRVIEAACAAVKAYGIGPATGVSTPPLEDLVRQARRFFAADSIVCVASGYLGPAVLAQALRDDHDVAFADSASHYSVQDALRAAGKPLFFFRHLDPDDLARQLALHVGAGQRPLVMTDGVFPSTGALAPLPAYAEALGRYPSSSLCVDDAHAVGVLGENGRGSLEHYSLRGGSLHFCATLSKAFGGSGGIIPGDAQLERRIREHSSIPLGASAPPAPALAAAAAGMRLLAEHPEVRRALWANARRARAGLRALGFSLPDTVVPIVSLTGGPDIDLRRVWTSLDREDIAVLYVPAGGYSDAPDVESLRIAVSSGHTNEQIDRLLDAVCRAL